MNDNVVYVIVDDSVMEYIGAFRMIVDTPEKASAIIDGLDPEIRGNYRVVVASIPGVVVLPASKAVKAYQGTGIVEFFDGHSESFY